MTTGGRAGRGLRGAGRLLLQVLAVLILILVSTTLAGAVLMWLFRDCSWKW